MVFRNKIKGFSFSKNIDRHIYFVCGNQTNIIEPNLQWFQRIINQIRCPIDGSIYGSPIEKK
jgi:hypothetical protein